MQQTTVVDELPGESPLPVANESVPNVDAQQERQRQYFLNHAETSSQFGANGMNSRVVSLRFSEDVTSEPEEVGDPDAADETEEAAAQP